jgi:hypothetical protein
MSTLFPFTLDDTKRAVSRFGGNVSMRVSKHLGGCRYSPPLITLGLIAVLGIAGLSACNQQPASAPVAPSDATEAETPPVPDTAVLADEMGKSFYFHGEFQDQFSDALFVVREDEGRGWGQILVLNRSDRSFQVPGNIETPLWIFGTVEALSEPELAQNEVPESEWSELVGQPVMVAKRITLVPPPNELANNPAAFLNQHVTVYGKVAPVAAANTFILEDPGLFGGKGIILIQGANADLSTVVDDEKAVVSGVLRPYVIADLQEEYDLPWELDLQERLEADFQESPVLVVDQALPANH